MSDRADVIYAYDGTFSGFLTCVFVSFSKKELPLAIENADQMQNSFYRVREVETDREKAERVYRAILVKISAEALELVQYAFLTCLEQKELWMLRFLRLGFRIGPTVMRMQAQDSVHTLQKAVLHLRNEAHLLMGFLRFSDCGGTMVAEIEPKNCVLPLLQSHFCTRFPSQPFFIYDRTHHLVLAHTPTAVAADGANAGAGSTMQTRIWDMPSFTVPPPDEDEQYYRTLWKRFYDTVAIQGRLSPLGRMTHMPKRYWSTMTEMAGEL